MLTFILDTYNVNNHFGSNCINNKQLNWLIILNKTRDKEIIKWKNKWTERWRWLIFAFLLTNCNCLNIVNWWKISGDFIILSAETVNKPFSSVAVANAPSFLDSFYSWAELAATTHKTRKSLPPYWHAATSYCYILLLVWHAPLGVRSAKRRHQSPEWTTLSHSYRLIQWEIVWSQVLLLHTRGINFTDCGNSSELKRQWWSEILTLLLRHYLWFASVAEFILPTNMHQVGSYLVCLYFLLPLSPHVLGPFQHLTIKTWRSANDDNNTVLHLWLMHRA